MNFKDQLNKENRQINEEFCSLLVKNKLNREKSFGQNILSTRQRSNLSSKLIYFILFLCFIGSIVIYILIRMFFIKKNL